MSATPTTLTVTYGSGSTATLTLPTSDGPTPQSFQQAVKNLFLGGGFWFQSATGLWTFVPWNSITLITAS